MKDAGIGMPDKAALVTQAFPEFYTLLKVYACT